MPEPRGRRRARELGRDPEAPRPSLGGAVCEWCETFGVHGPGDIAGQPFTFHADLERFVWDLYELEPPGSDGRGGGRRVIREAALVQPKGWAKSEAAGLLCAAEGLGPVRFDGWDNEGRPVGAPWSWKPKAAPAVSPEVIVFANDDHQAGNTFGATALNLHPDTCRPELLDEYGAIDVGVTPESSTRIILPDGGTIEKLSSRARSKEGGKTTFLVLEETHLWVLEAMLDLWRTGVRNVLKRSGTAALHASNWYAPGQGSVLEEFAKDVVAGSPGLLWCGRTYRRERLDPTKALRDQSRRALLAELVYVYGSAAAFVDLEALVDLIKRPSSKAGHMLKFYLNAEESLERQWVDRPSWAARMAPAGARLKPGDRVGLGFVGTDRNVALVAARLDDRLLEPVRVWEGEDPSREEVDELVDATFDRFRVARMLVNPWGWKTELERWAGRYGEKVVLRFPLREDGRTEVALDRWSTALVTGQLSHVGDETLTRHVAATSTRTRPGRVEPVNLEPSDTRLPITAAQAALLAHEAACQALADPAQAPRPKPATATVTAAPTTPSRGGSAWRAGGGGLRSRGNRL